MKPWIKYLLIVLIIVLVITGAWILVSIGLGIFLLYSKFYSNTPYDNTLFGVHNVKYNKLDDKNLKDIATSFAALDSADRRLKNSARKKTYMDTENNTWCAIIDDNGKEIIYIDTDRGPQRAQYTEQFEGKLRGVSIST